MPTPLPITVGLELELCGFDKSAPDERNVLIAEHVVKSVCPGYSVKTEHCGFTERGIGPEVVSPVLSMEEDLDDLVRVVDALQQAGFQVNDRCGLHVHTQMSLDHDDKTAKYRLMRFLIRHEDAFFKLCHPSRVDNRFCQRLPETFVESIRSNKGLVSSIPIINGRNETMRNVRRLVEGGQVGIRPNQAPSPNRYHWINPNSMFEHGTIENRLMRGMIDSEAVLGWVQFLIHLTEVTTIRCLKVPWDRSDGSIKTLIDEVFSLKTSRSEEVRRFMSFKSKIWQQDS